MQKIIDIAGLPTVNYYDNSSIIQHMQGGINDDMKLNGWILLILNDKECAVMKFDNEVFMNEGYVLNDEKVLKVFGNAKIGDISYNEESIVEEGIVDLDSGNRFEGRLLIEDKMGIPFGFGEMYDDDGKLIYKGIMINWERFGYGVSYHDNGEKEYEGYWCNDNRFGNGKVYDRLGKLVKECNWYNGNESDNYEGDGSNLHIMVKHLKLSNNCTLKDWDVSLFETLESIKIGDDCFASVHTFKIDGLNRLKSLEIGKNSFTQKKNDIGKNESKSFHILNCASLESILIDNYSFSDFGGEFELYNLPALRTLTIGEIKNKSFNFYYSSFVIRGILKY